MTGRFACLVRATRPVAGLVLIASVSCSPDRPLRPGADFSPAAVGVSVDEVAALVAALEDARLRIVPALADVAAAAELGAALEALAAGFSKGEPNAVGALARRARGALERYRSPADAAGAEAADVEALRLAVERAAALALPVAAAAAAPRAINERD